MGDRRAHARRRSDAHLRAAFEASTDGIVDLDDDGCIVSCNAAMQPMLGYGEGELVGCRLSDLLSGFDPQGGPRQEVEGRRKDGTQLTVELSLAQSSYRDQYVRTAILRDVTEQRRMQRQLVAAQRMEAAARVATGVAHDVNNLLTGLIAAADSVAGELEPDHRARRGVQLIREASLGGADMVARLMSFDRRQRERPDERCAVDAAVHGLQALLGRLVGEDVELRVELGAPGAVVDVARCEIERALMSLADNAKDAMPTGGHLTVRTEGLPDTAELGDRVLLEVQDDGGGMDEPVRLRAPDPYFTTKSSGNGLGLSAVYALVHELGGTVDLDSSPGAGTVVRLELPCTGGVAEPQAPEPEPAHTERPLTVLVVEDDPLVRMAARHYLERGGHRVLEATSGEEALRIYRLASGTIDVVVTDLVLPPGTQGIELGREVRRLLPRPGVVYMSAYPPDELVRRGMVAEELQVVHKPFTEPTLAAAVARAARVAAAGKP